MGRVDYLAMKTDLDKVALVNSDVEELKIAAKKLLTDVSNLGGLAFGVSFVKWIASFSAIYLLILDRTNWRTKMLTSLLIPYIFLTLPGVIFNFLSGDVGKWIAFVAVVLRLFFPKHFPDWLEMPGSLILLLVVSPHFLVHHIRGGWIGSVISLFIGCYLLQEHIRVSGGFRNSFTQPRFLAFFYSTHSGKRAAVRGKKMQNGAHGVAKEQPRVTLYIILTTAFLSLCFLLSLSSSYHSSPPYTGSNGIRPDPRLFPSSSKIAADTSPPSIAYLISGSSGDSRRILRLLFAAYHPRNRYLLHLDSLATQSERDRLALTVGDVPIFRAARNVDVVGRPDFAYRRGSSPMASTLHGASILLRLSGAWDWFVDLSVDEYPLVTQDELLHILSYLPKDLNFVNHTSYIGWKESRRLKPVIVDPGLYLVEKTDMFFASQKRELPKAFKLFSGPSFSILSRSFIEHCVLGTDNFPRTLLMYLANTPASLSNYFPTILCNSNLFKKTIINNNLLYQASNDTSKERRHQLDPKEFTEMVESGAAFARVSTYDDAVLDRIDHELLGRAHGEVVPGGWCLGDSEDNRSLCSVWGDSGILRPGSGSERLERRIVELLSNDWFRLHQCISE